MIYKWWNANFGRFLSPRRLETTQQKQPCFKAFSTRIYIVAAQRTAQPGVDGDYIPCSAHGP